MKSAANSAAAMVDSTWRNLGLETVWARGLGSRAPVTVGASQWSGVRPPIEKILRADA